MTAVNTKKHLYQGRITIPKFDDFGQDRPISRCNICKKVSIVFHIWGSGVKDINLSDTEAIVFERCLAICDDCQQKLMNQENTDDN